MTINAVTPVPEPPSYVATMWNWLVDRRIADPDDWEDLSIEIPPNRWVDHIIWMTVDCLSVTSRHDLFRILLNRPTENASSKMVLVCAGLLDERGKPFPAVIKLITPHARWVRGIL